MVEQHFLTTGVGVLNFMLQGKGTDQIQEVFFLLHENFDPDSNHQGNELQNIINFFPFFVATVNQRGGTLYVIRGH